MFRRGEGEDRQEQEPIRVAEIRGRHNGPGTDVTVVGKGARLDGNLVSAGSLQVDGQVKGSISAEGDVTLSSQSQVEAEISAQNVTVAGAFTGNIVAKNRAEVARGGTVHGNITSKVLVVAEGATFSGTSIMDGQGGGASPADRSSAIASSDSADAPGPVGGAGAERAGSR
jgi:cytoskeletal protein CcmA (bactofilin family)